jgi:uncharacterized protein YqgC (DUF456 family)
MSLLIAAILFLCSLIGIGLTIITLPGTWFILGVAVVIQWMWVPVFNKWVLIACAVLALVGEITDFALSAVGAAKSGGGKSGAWGSILGGLIGAVAGSFVLPILGTIAGAVIGAGLGAVALERGIAQRSWNQAIQIGKGAAVGRAAAMFVKAAIAAAIGISLTIDALSR